MDHQEAIEEIKVNEYNKKYYPEITQDNSVFESQENEDADMIPSFIPNSFQYYRENSGPVVDNCGKNLWLLNCVYLLFSRMGINEW